MKTSYAGHLIRINTDGRKGYSILLKEDFDRLVVQPGLSRKKAAELGIGSRLYNNTMNYYYGKAEIEAQRMDKIKNHNKLERLEMWKGNLDKLEYLVPGITELFTLHLKNEPELIEEKLQELNEWFYEIKDFIKTTKKYIRQAVNRKGGKPLKLVANLSEYKVRRILIELGYQVENQFYLKPYFYDFKVGNYLVEYDGQYHEKIKDKTKTEWATAQGYKVIRIKYFEIDNLSKLRERLKTRIKCSPNQE